MVLVGLAAGAWWWTRPGESWACVDGAAVECQRALDVLEADGAPEGDGWRLAFNSFDVTPDRGLVVAGFTRPADADGEAAARLVIHDLTASVPPQVIAAAPDGQPLTYVEGANWSADGSRLVAYVRTAGQDHLVVIDRSARYVGDIPLDDSAACSWRVGLSADGTTVRCGDGLFDLASGRFVATAPAEVDTAWGDELGGGILLADDGTTVDAVGDSSLTIDPGGQLVGLPSGGGEGFRLALDPPSTTLVVIERLDPDPAWRQPRRTRAQGRIAWVDLDSHAVTASALVEGLPYDVDTDPADGWTALLTADGDVLFLRPRA